jgi:hypothetical protein
MLALTAQMRLLQSNLLTVRSRLFCWFLLNYKIRAMSRARKMLTGWDSREYLESLSGTLFKCRNIDISCNTLFLAEMPIIIAVLVFSFSSVSA